MSEVSSKTRCPHELPVYHAAGRGKSRGQAGHARAPGAGDDSAAGSMSISVYPDQLNWVDFLVPMAL